LSKLYVVNCPSSRLTTSASSLHRSANARRTEMMWMAMNSLFKTSTLASRAELGLDCIHPPFLIVPRRTGPATEDLTFHEERRGMVQAGSTLFHPNKQPTGPARRGAEIVRAQTMKIRGSNEQDTPAPLWQRDLYTHAGGPAAGNVPVKGRETGRQGKPAP